MGLATLCLALRLLARDHIETVLTDWTSTQDAHALACQLQLAGIEAVPVKGFFQPLDSDPHLASRGHFIPLDRAVTGISHYERNGYSLTSDRGDIVDTRRFWVNTPSKYSPTHRAWIVLPSNSCALAGALD
jgi:hypothetical protein